MSGEEPGNEPRRQAAGSLVFDTYELGRRPGRQREVTRTVPAPSGFGVDVLSVPEGGDLRVDLRLEAVMEGVLVTGTASAGLVGECVRCLDRLEHALEVTFCELFAYPDRVDGGGGRAEAALGDVAAGEDGTNVEAWLEGDRLDLEPVIRDAVVLALPFRPVCVEDCPGLCPQCGFRLADDPEHRHDAGTDPRWSELAVWQDGTGGQPTMEHRSADRSAERIRNRREGA